MVLTWLSVAALQAIAAPTKAPSLGVGTNDIFAAESALERAATSYGLSNRVDVPMLPSRIALRPPGFFNELIAETRSSAFAVAVCEGRTNDLAPKFRVMASSNIASVVISFGAYYATRDAGTFDRFAARCRFYVDARVSGHSTNFIFQALNHSKSPDRSSRLGPFTGAEDMVWIPPNWPEQQVKDSSHVVIDGSLAWVYDRYGSCSLRDAQEFDARLRSQFEVAKKEAEAELDRRGIHEMDSSIFFNAELKRILSRKYKIDWRTPQELDR